MVDAQGCHVHAKRVNHHLPLLCKSRPNCCIWRSLGRRHWQQDGQHWGLGEFCLIFQNWQHFFPVGFRSDSRGHVWSPLWAATHHAWPDWAWSGLWVPGKPLSCDLGWQLWDFQFSPQINTMLISREFRFTSFARALAGNISPFASRSDSGLPPCSSYWLPPMPGATSSWCLIVFCSFFVCYITRFTEECFACLIAIIFIIKVTIFIFIFIFIFTSKAVESTIRIGYNFPINPSPCLCLPGNFTDRL